MVAAPPRRRPRRGSLERPVSTRIYRAVWLAVVVPVLVAAFSVGRPDPLPEPRLRPFFHQETAVQFTTEFANRFPDRSPGTDGARGAADWVEAQLREYGFGVERQRFTAEIPGRGEEALVNLVAVAPRAAGALLRSQEAIVVMAHRDNLGRSPGANDNGSGTAALLELARDVGNASLAHTLIIVSTDGGAFGALGAEAFAEHSPHAERVVGVIDLDAVAGHGAPRLDFAGDNSRVPSPTLLATTDARVRAQTGETPTHPGPVAQLLDLAFPFSLSGHAPFVARGIPAVTITTGAERPPHPAGDTLAELDRRRLGELGKSAQALLGSLDEAADVARGTDSYVYLGTRLVHGWTIQFVLLAALLPFLVAVVDLFARCRRRRIALWPGLRSYASRLGLWLWLGAVFGFFALVGIFPKGADRPIALDTPAATDWPVTALATLLALSGISWLVVHPRLAPTRSISRQEELGGHLAAMLVLGVIALVVAAVNPYALLFVLPSLHAWLWLPQVADRGRLAQTALYTLGLAGPLLLLSSFAFRLDLGLDAVWYLIALTAIGYVPLPLVLAFLAWSAAAAQVGALALGRYAPYPHASERPPRGPLREAFRQGVLFVRQRRRQHLTVVDDGEPSTEAETLEG
ncbi:MAG: M28 family peptidase [Gaiellaceae bacterium]